MVSTRNGEVSSMTLLDRYEDWRQRRSALAEPGEFVEDADALEDSDDAGIELLREFASAYEGALRAASNVIASWDQGDLAAAVRDLERVAMLLRARIHVLQQVAMLDTTSSVSRQHYIDTGRYLQEGESS
jgi:hypothetical protein